ncbi:MAG: hypothetical protein FJ265_05300 [Planctomycetes bacterium]|nr:hypothetical protein [Planctomycetota bacterium]
MSLCVTVLCVSLAQQLSVTPFPAEVGEVVTVRAERVASADLARVPIVDLAVTVELPDGSRRELGATGGTGEVQHVPQQPGNYVYSAVVGEVRVAAPHRVVRARRWLPALACVPLGLALLWYNLRRRC